MKRCPDCEFIYEEHQSVCDMDGQTLVHDHELSIIQPRTAAKPNLATPAKKSSLSGIALPVSAGLLLAVLFSVGYYSSSNSLSATVETGARRSASSELADPPATRDPFANVEVMAMAVGVESDPLSLSASQQKIVSPQPDPSVAKPAHAHMEATDQRFRVVRGLPPLPRLRPLPRLPEAKPLARKVDSGRIVDAKLTTQQRARGDAVTTGKKDSRVGAFLKKTGRALTKPFRL